jgi:hypothetical protein
MDADAEEFARNVERADRQWPRPAVAFYQGQATAEQLRAAAKRRTRDEACRKRKPATPPFISVCMKS